MVGNVRYGTVPILVPYGTVRHDTALYRTVSDTVPQLIWQFSGLHEVVLKQLVLRNGDGRMQAENCGFLAWHTSERPGSQANYTSPHVVDCAPFSFAHTGLLALAFGYLTNLCFICIEVVYTIYRFYILFICPIRVSY